MPFDTLLLVVMRFLADFPDRDVGTAAQLAEVRFVEMTERAFASGDRNAPNFALLADMASVLRATRVEQCGEWLGLVPWEKV
jgi:hypothetical protein